MSAASALERKSAAPFVHEALFYAGEDEFVDRAAAFLGEGVDAGEPALVVVSAAKIDLLRDALGAGAGRVEFADMADVGVNPARIIPAWRAFVDGHAGSGTRLRGVGEPIWGERTADELVECQRHEDLLNLALADSALWLVCSYDLAALPVDVLDEARRSHPFLQYGATHEHSDVYREPGTRPGPFEGPLSDPAGPPTELAFGPLEAVRAFVDEQASMAGLGREQVDQLVLAVNEVATNSLEHGGGRGLAQAWSENGTLVFEVRDGGCIDDPLAGRELARLNSVGGRGLWLANHLCDLVQIRSSAQGTVVRLHLRRR